MRKLVPGMAVGALGLLGLCFRAWANAPASGGSHLEVGRVRVGGKRVSPEESPGRTTA